MRSSGWLTVILAGVVGCGSDNQLEDKLDPDGTIEVPGPTDTTPNGEETTPPTNETDSPPTFTTDTGDPDGGGTPTPPDTGLTDDEICEAAAGLASFLDPYQTADDERVLYCHSSSGSNWVLIDSDISSCLPHINHGFDVFPTTGCDS